MRLLPLLVLAACGGSAELTKPAPPPEWPMENLLAERTTKLEEPVAPVAPEEEIPTLEIRFDHWIPELARWTCGEDSLEAVVEDGAVRLPVADGCTLKASLGEEEVNWSVVAARDTLTCSPKEDLPGCTRL